MLISEYRTDDIDTEATVNAFEEKHNISLPEVYRRFMMRCNGGLRKIWLAEIEKYSGMVQE